MRWIVLTSSQSGRNWSNLQRKHCRYLCFSSSNEIRKKMIRRDLRRKINHCHSIRERCFQILKRGKRCTICWQEKSTF